MTQQPSSIERNCLIRCKESSTESKIAWLWAGLQFVQHVEKAEAQRKEKEKST